MTSDARSIGGVPVTTRLAMRVEDSLQAFAVRAACFVSGQDHLAFSEELDGPGATDVIAHAGDQPVGTVRIRWFASFAMTERLAVMQRYRGQGIGSLLLERCRQLARSRGHNVLYTQVPPHRMGYWEKQGWRRLVPQAESRADAGAIVSMVKAVDPTRPLPGIETPPQAIVQRREPPADAIIVPVGTMRH